ncbi:gluconate 2-dehydrogenase subunit 3 family protein [Litoribacter alkaliphilus]|uniref:Gluconate 2-dehydrogenase subunit 3 family protein n=1 Tax=Litoribacter ruber TaxID=702568 RepID=A0AAP2CHG3_9BACT|nr:gluconate 2-dehydrogenase subunit 3 family protein [Litoribacter alkaliphilus]MBS9523779.1 gluconate 2-dehydrogenase subunit 3 family protein [Litoribacter alkaliphilus]
MGINRREALKSMVLMMGGTMIGANVILTGCAPEDRIEGLDFSESEIAFMDEIAETIIPATDTPGAKEAGVGSFMTVMVRETYNKEQQETFINGLNDIKKNFKSEVGVEFMDASHEQRLNFLNALNEELRSGNNESGPKYISMLKDLTVLGYFTSEIGATQALRYVETPGRYDGCMDYKKGDKAFAL